MVNFAHLKSAETIEKLRDGDQDKDRHYAFERSDIEMDRGRGPGHKLQLFYKQKPEFQSQNLAG
jgi:hypothetical protein